MAARLKRIALAGVFLAALYALLAYAVLPALWTHYEHQRRLANVPMLTTTAQGIPGDPVNIGLTGIGPTLAGKNGEGDAYYTDGEVWMLRLVTDCRPNDGPIATLSSPAAVEIKDALWQALAGALKQ